MFRYSDFKVGQKWRTRSGGVVTVLEVKPSLIWGLSVEMPEGNVVSFDGDGRYDAGGDDHDFDLVEQVPMQPSSSVHSVVSDSPPPLQESHLRAQLEGAEGAKQVLADKVSELESQVSYYEHKLQLKDALLVELRDVIRVITRGGV